VEELAVGALLDVIDNLNGNKFSFGFSELGLNVTYGGFQIEVHCPWDVLATSRLAEESAESQRRSGFPLLEGSIRVETVLKAVELN